MGQQDLDSNPDSTLLPATELSASHRISPSLSFCPREMGVTRTSTLQTCQRIKTECWQWLQQRAPPGTGLACASATSFSASSRAQWKKPAWQGCHASFPRPSCHLKGPRASSGARLPEAGGRCGEEGCPAPHLHAYLGGPAKHEGRMWLEAPPDSEFMPLCSLPLAGFSDLSPNKAGKSLSF